MIFTDNRLVERAYEVRFFYYDDGSTAFYAVVPRSDFIGRIRKRHPSVNGVYYDYIIRPSYLRDIGYDADKMGYTLAKEGQRQREVDRHKEALSKLKLK